MAGSKEQAEGSSKKRKVEIVECAFLCPDDRHDEFEYGAYCIANIARIDASLQKPIKGKEPSRVIRELEHLDKVLGKLSGRATSQLNEASRLQSFLDCLVELIQQLDEVPDLLTSDETIRKDASSRIGNHLEGQEMLVKQASDAFGRLSPDALARLNVAANPLSPSNGTVKRIQRIIRLAVGGIKKGRSKRDEVRAELGQRASAIWNAHEGDVNEENFADFVEVLIKEAGFDKPENKPRVSDETLVNEIRENVAKHGAPIWDLWGPE